MTMLYILVTQQQTELINSWYIETIFMG